MQSFEEKKLEFICEAIDNLMITDFHARGIVRPIYDVLRKKIGQPLTLKAAQGLWVAIQGDSPVVFITTGFLIAPFFRPETDGPFSAALVARALSVLGAKPVIIAEENVIPCLEASCLAAELIPCYDIDKAIAAAHAVALVTMPADRAQADAVCEKLYSYQPKAIIDIEHPGKGDDGKYYSALGRPLAWAAPIDDLFEGCRARGAFTVGVGDLGNEIGMGCAKPEIHNLIPYGPLVSAKTDCDAPIMSCISDFGAYALLAALEAVSGKKNVLHSAQLEEIVMRAGVAGGAVEGCWGIPTPALDMIDVEYCCAYVKMLRAVLIYSEVMSESRPFFVDFGRGIDVKP